MRKLYWLAVAAVALTGASNSAQAQGILSKFTSKPAMPAPVVTTAATNPEMPPAEMVSDPSAMAPAGCADGTCGATCGSQGPGKVRRLVDWLTYRPLPSKCKSCDSSKSYCHPPLIAFFPCDGGYGGCATCGGHAPAMTMAAPAMTTAAAAAPAPVPTTLYYTKAAEAPATESISQTSYPSQTPTAASNGNAGKPADAAYHPTTYKPANIAKTMPVLPPTQFRGPNQ